MPAVSRVLVVDDDADIRFGISTRLKMAGYETLTACDGEEAVNTAAACLPNAVLMDVRMPRKDGLTALAELHERPGTSHIPVVILSASLSDERRALNAGACFFLRKPYRGQNLLSALECALTMWPKELRASDET